jgi:hypothetical protein
VLPRRRQDQNGGGADGVTSGGTSGQPLSRLEETEPLAPHDLEKVAHLNAERILRL